LTNNGRQRPPISQGIFENRQVIRREEKYVWTGRFIISATIPLAPAGLAMLVGVALTHHPFATNDGPVHVTVDLRHTTNILTYLLLGPLISATSPQTAESFIQALCLVGPMAAGWMALRAINRENAWLAIFIFSAVAQPVVPPRAI